MSAPASPPATTTMSVPGSVVPRLWLAGVDHHSATLTQREKVALDSEQAARMLRRITDLPGIAEALLLSTCNRVEAYFLAEAPIGGHALAGSLIEQVFTAKEPTLSLEQAIYLRSGQAAVEHLFTVAAGLRSMVLGEAEILGQVRAAWHLARQQQVAGTGMDRLLTAASQAGRRVRRETGLNEGATSFGAAVVALAREELGQLAGRTAMILGAGKTALQVGRRLSGLGWKHLWIGNRSVARRTELSQKLQEAENMDLDEARRRLVHADLVAATTACREPWIGRSELQDLLARRSGSRPLLIVDLAVPRNVAPAAADLPGLRLVDLDQLGSHVARSQQLRRQHAQRADGIVQEELQRLVAADRLGDAEAMLAVLHRWAEELRQEELRAVLGKHEQAPSTALEHLSRRLVRRLLHHPSMALRGERGPALAPALDELFALSSEKVDGED